MSVRVIHGDMREQLRVLRDDGVRVQSIVTDPPYHLTNRTPDVKWCVDCQRVLGGNDGKPAQCPKCGGRLEYQRSAGGRGFMGKAWDGGDIAFQYETWRLCFDLLPPGGHLLAFAGTRTYHRMAAAIEEAGFEMRDTIMYLYGSGFPKSRRVNQSPMFCQCGEAGRNAESKDHAQSMDGHSDTVDASFDGGLLQSNAQHSSDTALDFLVDCPPDHGSHDEQLRHAQERDPTSFPSPQYAPERSRSVGLSDGLVVSPSHSLSSAQRNARPSSLDCSHLSQCVSAERENIPSSTSRADISGSEPDKSGNDQGLSSANYAKGFPRCPICGKPNADGYGTALKPAAELVCVARRPLIGTVAANVLAHGTGALNIDACRVATDGPSPSATYRAKGKAPSTCKPGEYGDGHAIQNRITPERWLEERPGEALGRWPANVVTDGSDEVVKAFPESDGQSGAVTGQEPSSKTRNIFGLYNERTTAEPRGDSGSAARFFYSARSDDEKRFWYGSKADADDRLARDVEIVEVSWTSELGPHQAKLLADTGQSPERAIVASALGDAREWNTFLCGSGITDLCRRASNCTTRMGTSWTTASGTWRPLLRSLTSASTAVAPFETANGGSPAASAGPNILSATITVGQTVSLPGASHAMSGTQLTISVSARRQGTFHPTVKPVDLMRWLVRLVTPPGGTCLDPFAGSGTTGMACMAEGFDCILVEREAEYVADIRARIAHVHGDDTPLFSGVMDDA